MKARRGELKRYRVTRKGPLLAAISDAIRASGGRIIVEPSPTSAPFEYVIETHERERIELVCYAFVANRYRQSDRPADEHRFQVKYGSDFKQYHTIFLDPLARRVTLFFGVHLEEGVFVAADPEANNPTWFSKSIEFKDENIQQARTLGWVGWERERHPSGRRKQEMPLVSYATEALLGFTAKHFGRYVAFERAATGLHSSERIALARTFSPQLERKPNLGHALELAFGLSATQILDIVQKRQRVLMNVRGSIAEAHLLRHLQSIRKLKGVEQNMGDSPPDFRVLLGSDRFGIECKNIRSGLTRRKVDFQRTRAPKSNPCGRYYAPQRRSVLAACLQPDTGLWEFEFCPMTALAPHPTCEGRISPNVYLDQSQSWTRDVIEALLESKG